MSNNIIGSYFFSQLEIMTSTKFKEGENVLCREEDGLIYDAKVII